MNRILLQGQKQEVVVKQDRQGIGQLIAKVYLGNYSKLGRMRKTTKLFINRIVMGSILNSKENMGMI